MELKEITDISMNIGFSEEERTKLLSVFDFYQRKIFLVNGKLSVTASKLGITKDAINSGIFPMDVYPAVYLRIKILKYMINHKIKEPQNKSAYTAKVDLFSTLETLEGLR